MHYTWQTLPFAGLDGGQLYALLRLREQVFILEQQCLYPDLDDRDQLATHILCRAGDTLAGYARCLPPDSARADSSLGRVVVAPAQRRRQLGRELVRRGIAHNLTHWPGCDIGISAQAHLQPFYHSLGFVAEGAEYLEDGIAHRAMRHAAAQNPLRP